MDVAFKPWDWIMGAIALCIMLSLFFHPVVVVFLWKCGGFFRRHAREMVAGSAIISGLGLTIWCFAVMRQNTVEFDLNVRDNILAAYRTNSPDEFKVQLTTALDYLRDTGRDSGDAYSLGQNDIGKWYMELETVLDAVDLPKKDEMSPLHKAQSLLRDKFIKGGQEIKAPPDIQSTPYVWRYVAWAVSSISLALCGLFMVSCKESEVDKVIRETRARLAAERKKPKPPPALPAAAPEAKFCVLCGLPTSEIPDIRQATHQVLLQERDELAVKLADAVRERDELKEKLPLGLRKPLSVESPSHDKRMSEALAILKELREQREAYRARAEAKNSCQTERRFGPAGPR